MPGPHLIRSSVLLVAAAIALVLTPSAVAQNSARLRGLVTDHEGTPVEDATILIEYTGDLDLIYEITTDAEGRYLQMGLARGTYNVTISKGDLQSRRNLTLMVGQEFPLDIQFLAPGEIDRESLSAEVLARLEAAEATNAAFRDGLTATSSGNLDEAVDLFKEAIAGLPDCVDCFRNLGIVELQRENYEAAESALRRATELAPDDPASFGVLAELYNTQRRFDEAGAASAEARRLSGGAAGGGTGDAGTVFDQGLIAWNAGQLDDARGLFQQTLELDPDHGEAHYWMGMASLNAGQIPEAVAFWQTYLDRDPNGRFVAEATALVAQLAP